MFFSALRLVTAAVVVGAAGVSLGEVVFTGTVTPGEPAGVEPTTTVAIGPTSQSPLDADPRGGVEVNGGSQFTAGRVLVGDSESALAKMVVTGAGTKASVVSAGSTSTPTLGVGLRGSGYLRVDNGAWLQVGETHLGVLSISPRGESPGLATVEVVGESSLLTVGKQLLVSDADFSILNVRDGAVVRVGPATGVLGEAVLIQGKANVTGERTELQTNGLTVGSRGQSLPYGPGGVLRVSEGAVVRSMLNSNNSRADVGHQGRLELDGGTIALHNVQVEGVIAGSGVVVHSVSVAPLGLIEVGENDSLRLASNLTSAGRIRVEGGSMEIGGDLLLHSGTGLASIDVAQGKFALNGHFDGGGSLRFTDSVVEIGEGISSRLYGTLQVERSLLQIGRSLSIESSTEIIDSELIVSSQGLRITASGTNPSNAFLMHNSVIRDEASLPGGPLWIDGVLEIHGESNSVGVELRSTSRGALRLAAEASIELDTALLNAEMSLNAGSSVFFSGYATVGNTVSVALSNSNLTTPSILSAEPLTVNGSLTIDASAMTEIAAGQVFSLFEAESLSMYLSEIVLPDLPGTLEFVPQLTETEFSLLVVDSAVTLPGDYNGDGCVDAADYTVLRDSDLPASNAMAMANWKTNYGRWLPGSNMPIPEPTAVVVVAMGLAVVAAARR
ncbi:hypothetical protein [Botrimarina mediterranea]|uniref:hypothetical protein n=1 Tax=Botrimarina mediterranea TaxID=2528022 RepID=UPI00118C362F|nr:hypothetical protein K2D_00880 [Planctomycetes bacterium K2D]